MLKSALRWLKACHENGLYKLSKIKKVVKILFFFIFYNIKFQINDSKRIKQHFHKSIDQIKNIRMGIILLKFSSLYIQDLYCVLFRVLFPFKLLFSLTNIN